MYDRKTLTAMAERIVDLKKLKFSGKKIVRVMHKEGFRSSTGTRLTPSMIGGIYRDYRIKQEKKEKELQRQGELPFGKDNDKQSKVVSIAKAAPKLKNSVPVSPYPEHVMIVINDNLASQELKDSVIASYHESTNTLLPSEAFEDVLSEKDPSPMLYINRTKPDGTRGDRMIKISVGHSEVLLAHLKDIRSFCAKHSKKDLFIETGSL